MERISFFWYTVEKMQIEIDIPRPGATLALLLAIGWGWYAWSVHTGGMTADVLSTGAQTQSVASSRAAVVRSPADYSAVAASATGATMSALAMPNPAQDSVTLARYQQEVLKRKADILRGELRVLEAERKSLGDQVDPALEQQFRSSTIVLTSLLQDQRKAEDFIRETFSEIWEAQGRAIALGEGETEAGSIVGMTWPVEPKLGLSAIFHDPSYEQRFGFPHDAIDIPVPQGTVVRAAAGGTVKDVVDHGLGFSYITIKHAGGVSTLYGHINKFLVQSGQVVRAGDPIGLSGGRPGTLGAGLSTGPHLHFGVYKNGVAVDPESYLPTYTIQSVPMSTGTLEP